MCDRRWAVYVWTHRRWPSFSHFSWRSTVLHFLKSSSGEINLITLQSLWRHFSRCYQCQQGTYMRTANQVWTFDKLESFTEEPKRNHAQTSGMMNGFGQTVTIFFTLPRLSTYLSRMRESEDKTRTRRNKEGIIWTIRSPEGFLRQSFRFLKLWRSLDPRTKSQHANHVRPHLESHNNQTRLWSCASYWNLTKSHPVFELDDVMSFLRQLSRW